MTHHLGQNSHQPSVCLGVRHLNNCRNLSLPKDRTLLYNPLTAALSFFSRHLLSTEPQSSTDLSSHYTADPPHTASIFRACCCHDSHRHTSPTRSLRPPHHPGRCHCFAIASRPPLSAALLSCYPSLASPVPASIASRTGPPALLRQI